MRNRVIAAWRPLLPVLLLFCAGPTSAGDRFALTISPDAPAELAQFGQLVGKWRIND